jgi:hypothetical protein
VCLLCSVRLCGVLLSAAAAVLCCALPTTAVLPFAQAQTQDNTPRQIQNGNLSVAALTCPPLLVRGSLCRSPLATTGLPPSDNPAGSGFLPWILSMPCSSSLFHLRNRSADGRR